VEKDPFVNFISDLSEKIKINREHKQIMERVNDPKANIDESKASLENLILKIKEKIEGSVSQSPISLAENITEKQAQISSEVPPVTSTNVKVMSEEDNNFNVFVDRLKGILNKPREIITNTPTVSSEKTTSQPFSKNENQEVITSKDYIKGLETKKKKSNKTQNYVDELEKVKDAVQVEKEDTKVTEIKKLIEEYAEKYIKKAVGMMGETGGGTVAVQYANGGTMNGDLNVNGHILSGGVDLLDIFSEGGGGESGDPVVNALVHANSGQWNEAYSNLVSNSAAYLSGYDLSSIAAASGNWDSTYTTVQAFSANWDYSYTTISENSACWDLGCEAYSNLVSNSAAYLSAVDISELIAASGNWNSNYTTVSENSAYWADTRYDVTFANNVTVNGNLTALGSSTFKNTIFTTTSALSVVNLGPGPALYVYQAAGPYDVASFYDGDGVEVLHVGNANVGQGGKVGINESYPTVELTVNGQISANNTITALGGNSDQWNSNYTTTNTNSANWGAAYTNNSTLSAPQLPVPKILLAGTTNVQYLTGRSDNYQKINTLRYGGNITINKSPILVVNDITQETLNAYQIFIEMVMFRKNRVRSRYGLGETYKNYFSVPVDSNAASKPWGANFWQRSGSEPQYKPAHGGFYPHLIPNVLRHNQLSVSSSNQVIDLSPCLNGRFREAEIIYSSDPNVVYYNDSINCIAPFMLLKVGSGNRIGYSARYKPMYIAFRYIAWLPNKNNGRGEIVSGPLSPTIRVSNIRWPFKLNHYLSSKAKRPIVELTNSRTNWNNLYKKEFICRFI